MIYVWSVSHVLDPSLDSSVCPWASGGDGALLRMCGEPAGGQWGAVYRSGPVKGSGVWLLLLALLAMLEQASPFNCKQSAF